MNDLPKDPKNETEGELLRGAPIRAAFASYFANLPPSDNARYVEEVFTEFRDKLDEHLMDRTHCAYYLKSMADSGQLGIERRGIANLYFPAGAKPRRKEEKKDQKPKKTAGVPMPGPERAVPTFPHGERSEVITLHVQSGRPTLITVRGITLEIIVAG